MLYDPNSYSDEELGVLEERAAQHLIPVTTPVMVYTRLDETGMSRNPSTKKWSRCRRGVLEIKGHRFPTIERLDRRVWLRPNEKYQSYQCVHHNKKGFTSKRTRKFYGSLRPIHTQKVWSESKRRWVTAGILIHVANWSYQLEGCIAPGMREASNLSGKGTAVSGSRRAMMKIFELLGGYQYKNQFAFRVVGDMYRK